MFAVCKREGVSLHESNREIDPFATQQHNEEVHYFPIYLQCPFLSKNVWSSTNFSSQAT
jgi:hypothetical protein